MTEQAQKELLGWGWRLGKMPQPARAELKPYADKLHEMQFQGQRPGRDGTGVIPLHGICYLDDLRGKKDRDDELI